MRETNKRKSASKPGDSTDLATVAKNKEIIAKQAPNTQDKEELNRFYFQQAKAYQGLGMIGKAIKDAQQIPQHEARRRQMQYIGKVMRKLDPEPIQNALQNFQMGNNLKALEFKKIEQLSFQNLGGSAKPTFFARLE